MWPTAQVGGGSCVAVVGVSYCQGGRGLMRVCGGYVLLPRWAGTHARVWWVCPTAKGGGGSCVEWWVCPTAKVGGVHAWL